MSDTQDPGSLSLQIVTPHKAVLETDVSIVTLPGSDGVFGVMPGHSPFITTLRPGVLEFEEGGMPRRMAVSAGIVEVTQDRVIVLSRTCESRDDIDVERATRAKERLETELAGKTHADESWDRLEIKLNRAIARLDVCSL